VLKREVLKSSSSPEKELVELFIEMVSFNALKVPIVLRPLLYSSRKVSCPDGSAGYEVSQGEEREAHAFSPCYSTSNT